MTNDFRPHVHVLPEDEAIRQIANGFNLHNSLKPRVLQILPIADGWPKVIKRFTNDHVPKMRNNPNRMLVMLIDFDKRQNRLAHIKSKIPKDLENRVFVLGIWSNPESLRRALEMKLEGIGEALAQDCSDNQQTFWNHELLRDNHPELERLRSSVRPFLFE